MKKVLRRAGILLGVFLLGVIGTSLLLNSETTDDRTEMESTTLPEVFADIDGIRANRMYGYRQRMQADFMRDSLTPIGTSQKVDILIEPYGETIKGMSYEIRTSDGSKVLENRNLKNLEEEDTCLKGTISVESDMRMSQEYSLEITVDTEAGPVYYYTRIVQRSNLNTGKYLQFALDFSEKSLNKAQSEELTDYLEANVPSADGNYSNVSIQSSLSTINWGSLNPQIYRRGTPVVKEINETTGSVALEYQVSAQDDNGSMEVYDVEEFYRLRYDQNRIYLLDFKRQASQVFNGENVTVGEDGLLLGVRNRNVDYQTSPQGDIVVFVQEGDLWEYHIASGKIGRVFSFRQEDSSDMRDIRTEHDIKIIRVEDNGDVDFVLYGYMNRGDHEGMVGVGAYHYNNDQNVVEEKVFIPSTESFEFLKHDLEVLSYVNQQNQLFLFLAEKLYQVEIDENSYEILEENISSDNFYTSETGSHAAWTKTAKDGMSKAEEIDFESLERRTVSAPDGQKLKLYGYMNEDLVYGLAGEGDIVSEGNGNEIFGASQLKIEGFDGTVKKEYQPQGTYITQVDIGATLMEMVLSQKNGSTYQAVQTDSIMNNVKASSRQVEVENILTTRQGTVIRLAFSRQVDNDQPVVVYAKMRTLKEDKEIRLETKIPENEMYYVYAGGQLQGIYRNPSQAVQIADENTGVVLNRAQQYVWERGNKKEKIQLSIADIPEALRQASLDVGALKEAVKEEGTVLDLTGCTLDSVLYEISAQRPVIVKTGENTSLLMVGYDAYNTYLYDPATGETSPYGMNDSTALFEKAGNVFITYIEEI